MGLAGTQTRIRHECQEVTVISRRSSVGLGFATLATLGLSVPAESQRVSADIYVSGSPVSGVVRIGDHPRPRHVVVERHVMIEPRRDWSPRHYRDAKVVVVYYDRGRNLYFDKHRKGLERVRVFRLNDRYYRYDDYDRDRRNYRTKYDRHDRRDRRDWDDRYDRRDRDHRDDRRGRGRH